MKTKLFTLLALIGLHLSHGGRPSKTKRGYFLGDASLSYGDDLNLSQSGWKVSTGDFNLDVELPPPRNLPPPQIQKPRLLSRPIPTYGVISNSLNKPVIESQEYIPPQATGTAILPQMPPPAIPVNAVAANVPASNGATYLGSGSIGVVSLGNGAYALGSGSLGYSENRSRPRPSARVPVYPPIRASPNLLPAAVPSPQPPQPVPPIAFTGNLDFGHPLLDVPQVPQVDQNGYEYLAPNRVAFGTPNPPRPIRTRQQFATPTALQVQPQLQPQQQVFQFSQLPLGHPILDGIPPLA